MKQEVFTGADSLRRQNACSKSPIFMEQKNAWPNSFQLKFLIIYLRIICQRSLHTHNSIFTSDLNILSQFIIDRIFLFQFEHHIYLISIPMRFQERFISVLLLFLALSGANCTLGVSTELGTYYSTAVFQCVMKSGYMDATVLAFSSSTGVKPYAIQDIMNIKNSGINISIWLNPCRSRDPKVQIQDFMKKVPKQIYDRIWIAPDNNPEQNCSWYNQKHPIDPASNCKYLLSILNQVKSAGLKTGVLTNKFVWGLIFKDTCLEAGSQALYWLPQAPNGVPSFDDFNPFAGWSQPSVKAYRTSAIVCGAYLNLHYYP